MVEIGRIECGTGKSCTLGLINLQVFNGLGRGGRAGREGRGGEGRAKKYKELYTSLLQAFLSIL